MFSFCSTTSLLQTQIIWDLEIPRTCWSTDSCTVNCNDPNLFIKDQIHSEIYKTTWSIQNSVGNGLPKTPSALFPHYDLKARGRAQQTRSHVSRQNVGKGSDVRGRPGGSWQCAGKIPRHWRLFCPTPNSWNFYMMYGSPKGRKATPKINRRIPGSGFIFVSTCRLVQSYILG